METALSSLRDSLEQTNSPFTTSSLLTLGEELQGQKGQLRDRCAFYQGSMCEIQSPAHTVDQRHPGKPNAGEICVPFRITPALEKSSGSVD